VYAALNAIDFLAVADLMMTPTAALADIVLPAASYLEYDAAVVTHLGKGDTCIQAQQKVVQIGECRSDLEIVLGLADKLGLGEHFWRDSRVYLDDYLKKAGLSFDELCRRDMLVTSGTQYRKYLDKGFNTPSGKVELYSSLCDTWGYAPLPDFHEPSETPFSAPHLTPAYPLILTSGHEPDFIHSQGRQLSTLRNHTPEPLALLHPDTAAGLGIGDGDWVVIESQRGAIRQKARLTQDVDPRVISVAYGWWFPEQGAMTHYGWDAANINVLTDDGPPYSPEIGSPAMRGFLCRVSKA
jgi:anaerobic selenocysteine-containing dehydrogenase